jgi:hypothetical protein
MSYGRCCVTEPRSSTALRLDIFIEIPLVSLMDLNQRPLTYGAPDLADDRLKTQTMFVLTPQLYLRCWIALFESQYSHRELFLKASCSAFLAFSSDEALGPSGCCPASSYTPSLSAFSG